MSMYFNSSQYTVKYRSKILSLYPKEFILLHFLYLHQGQSFSREQLLDHVWKMESPSARTVNDYIYRLRKKFEK